MEINIKIDQGDIIKFIEVFSAVLSRSAMPKTLGRALGAAQTEEKKERTATAKLFQANEHKETIKHLLREGTTVKEILDRFPISERTVMRYNKEVREEKK
jgi:DNA-binding NarL/FixJ family response regulator